MEKWKIIKSYPDYKISNIGNVMSKKSGNFLFIKPGMARGYKFVNLCNSGVCKKITIHKLVLEHFGPTQPENTTPDHIDRNPLNNSINNLRWATHEEQTNNRNMPKGIMHSNSKLCEEDVVCIKQKLLEGCTQKELGRQYGVHPSLIGQIKTGIAWKHVK